ncbi:MAG: hypothetical protein NC417_00530, partial [Candidatus Gastranaerophilales bacterium]|nr:hypothetical protein [Candidatus Gastranaerophilales bacterium]
CDERGASIPRSLLRGSSLYEYSLGYTSIVMGIDDDPRLSVQAQNIILNEENTIFYSIASVWEVAIKHIKKPDQMLLNDEEFVKGCKMAGFKAVSIKEQHILLIPYYEEPFIILV